MLWLWQASFRGRAPPQPQSAHNACILHALNYYCQLNYYPHLLPLSSIPTALFRHFASVGITAVRMSLSPTNPSTSLPPNPHPGGSSVSGLEFPPAFPGSDPIASSPQLPQRAEASLAPDSDSAPPKGSGNKSSSAQHKSLAHALIPDLPLLMHGSGDVLPEQVDPVSVATLARLIENYVASLVSAAVDAHDIFTDGEVVGGSACLGPPPFRAPAGGRESDGDDAEVDFDDDEKATKKRKTKERASRRQKKANIDYWDLPLPPVKENNADGNLATNDGLDSSNDSEEDSNDDSDDDDDDDEPLIAHALRRSTSLSTTNSDSAIIPAMQGLAPLDLHANERIRNFYVASPTVMDARSFIFPICHDAFLYQRVKEVQASRRAIQRDVVDPVLLDVMMEEGRNEGRRGMVDMYDGVLGRRRNNNDGDKKKAHDKKKEVKTDSEEKIDDSANVVGAGLLDAGIDPSWPGLDSLSRGRLW